MNRSYHPVAYLLGGSERYLIWFSTDLDGDHDGVHVDSSGRVPTFGTVEELASFARVRRLGPLIRGDAGFHDLDSVVEFCEEATADEVDCPGILEAWNLFNYIARSCGDSGSFFRENEGVLDPIYDKVFWGCNLPAMTPEGARFEPSWSPDELHSLRGLMKAGLDLFRSCVAASA